MRKSAAAAANASMPVLKVLVEKFNISPIGNVDEDLAQMLNK